MKLLLAFFVVGAMRFLVDSGEIFNESDETIIKVITSYGYPIETHHVETEDGYILTIFRIPYGKNTNKTNNWPILLNHGMFGSSENFILTGPKSSLAYILAENGYDVWIINNRGTWHSKNHVKLKPDNKNFWVFSWHEIGVYDIPAVVDHILDVTNKSSISYLGHSQGCTSFFVMASERPEYNKKIKVMIALGPGAIYKNVKHELLLLGASYSKSLQVLAKLLNIYYLPPPFFSGQAIRDILQSMCVESTTLNKTCKELFLLISEISPEHIDMNLFRSILPLIPGTISVKQAFHYAQLIQSGNFQQFDYGKSGNLKRYGTKDPPLYNLKNVTLPVALYYGKKDLIVTKEDVQLLAEELPNVVVKYQVPRDSFSHLDFILSTDANTLLYKQILKILYRYKNK